jgi:hypothetical protein
MATRFSLKAASLRFVITVSLSLLAISALVCSGVPARAQTDTFIAGSGAWSPMGNWSLDAVPGQSNDCVLPANSVVTSDLAGVCANFTLNSKASLTVTPGYLDVYGSSFVNQATITVGPGNGLQFAQPSVTTTISGGGTITLTTASTQFTGSENTVVNTNNTIQGQGYIGVYKFSNQSLINANIPAAQLELAGGVSVTNTGTMQASNGATLLLQGDGLGVPLNNTGGTIQALAGSKVMVDAFAISGGTLVSNGTGMFSTFAGSGNPSLSNLTNKANYLIVSGGSSTIAGTIDNLGTIQAKGTLFVNGSTTLKGGSVPIAAPAGTINSLSAGATLVNQSTIAGSGNIGDSSLTLNNQGTIDATHTADILVLSGLPTTNTGTMEASGGGTLQIQNTVNNVGGTIQALNGSTVLLYSNSNMISGGTLKTIGSGTFDTNSGTLDGTVNPITNAGMFKVSQGNLSMQGTINNTGTIALNTSGYFVGLTEPTVLTGSGKVIMSPNTSFLAYAPTNTLTNRSTIEGAGSIGDSDPMGIINEGIILADSTSPLTISPDPTLGFTNHGKLVVNEGSVLNIAGVFNNFIGGKLAGGTYEVAGTLEFPNAVVTNAANLEIMDATAKILDSSTNTNALAKFVVNAPVGSLLVEGGQMLTTATKLSNAGKITVGIASSFKVGTSYMQTAGTTTVDGTLTAPKGLILLAGSLVGKGTLDAAVTSGASVTAGDSSTTPGTLTVSGSYTQTSTGILNISIGGTTAGTYGKVAVSNGVSLGGTLAIKLINSFVPTIGDTFTIASGSAVTGQFATVTGASINSGEHFEVSYSATAVTLTVVSGA